MPIYLLHGFRWPRPLIRIHIILQNLDDAAAEWLVAPGTTATLLDNFTELYPDTMNNLQQLRFVEQYDPDDETPGVGSQPFAYVADIVHEIKLSLDIDDVRGKGLSNDQWGSILELRDKLAPEEKVGWYVVNCGDEERWAPPIEEEEVVTNGYSHAVPYSPPAPPVQSLPNRSRSKSDARSIRSVNTVKTTNTVTSSDTRRDFGSPEVPQKGFKKFMGVLTRRKSRQSIRELHSSGSNHSFEAPPPVPALPPGIKASGGSWV